MPHINTFPTTRMKRGNPTKPKLSKILGGVVLFLAMANLITTFSKSAGEPAGHVKCAAGLGIMALATIVVFGKVSR